MVHLSSQRNKRVTENSANTEVGKIPSRKKRATATRFDLAQGSHHAIEQVGKRTRKICQEKNTDSISNKGVYAS